MRPTSATKLFIAFSSTPSNARVRTFVPMTLAAASSFSCEREQMATLAPLTANAFAVASPVPELPPTTTADFPESVLIGKSDMCTTFCLSEAQPHRLRGLAQEPNLNGELFQ